MKSMQLCNPILCNGLHESILIPRVGAPVVAESVVVVEWTDETPELTARRRRSLRHLTPCYGEGQAAPVSTHAWMSLPNSS